MNTEKNSEMPEPKLEPKSIKSVGFALIGWFGLLKSVLNAMIAVGQNEYEANYGRYHKPFE